MEAASFGWARTMKDPVVIIGGNFIAVLCMGLVSSLGSVSSRVFQMAASDMSRTDPEIFAGILFGIGGGAALLNFLVSSLFVGGYTRFLLKIARGEPYAIGDIFGGMGMFGKVLMTRFLVGGAVLIGLLLCWIPGMIVGLGLSQTMYLVVDKGMEPIDAMKESWRLTDGQKVNVFIFGVISFFAAMAGLLACCIGVYVAVPVIAIGGAYIHLRLTRQPTATA